LFGFFGFREIALLRFCFVADQTLQRRLLAPPIQIRNSAGSVRGSSFSNSGFEKMQTNTVEHRSVTVGYVDLPGLHWPATTDVFNR
jgi:hypothetical protein